MTQHICDSEFPWCPSDARTGDFYKLRLRDFASTQFAIGKTEVQVHARRLRKKFDKDPGKLHDYLRVRPTPVVVKDGKFHLVDHHHLTRGLYDDLHETLGNKTSAYVKVLPSFFRTRILLDQDLLAGRHTFDEFAFVVDEHGRLELNDDGKAVIDEALFLASGAEARGLPGFRGPSG